MKRRFGLILSTGLILAGSLVFFLALKRPAFVIMDEEIITVQTRAFTAAGVLRSAGITVTPLDQVTPEVNSLVGWMPIVKVRSSKPVYFWMPGMDTPAYIISRERIAGNLVAQFGVKLFPGDRLVWNGQEIHANTELAGQNSYVIQYTAAIPITIRENGQTVTIHNAASTLAEALWQSGIQLNRTDQVSLPLSRHPMAGTELAIQHAIPITILTAFGSMQCFTPAMNAGSALAAAGLSLQGLDYSLPVEDSLLERGNEITLVRVQEESLLDQQIITFSSEYIADPETVLDQTRVITPGHYGLQVARIRVRYEDGEEVSRVTDSEWTASLPQNEQIGYGTKVTVNTLSTPAGNIEYWRSVEVYATSYSPCNLGTGSCNDATASGAILQEGIIAVSTAWYSWMRGQRVYIPGYGFGTIADAGGGIPGQYWIDLGYTDDTYVPWHQNVTMYFLTPIPSTIPYTLP